MQGPSQLGSFSHWSYFPLWCEMGSQAPNTWAARRNNQSLRNAPRLHIHRGVLSESTYRDEDLERAMQPEAVLVVRCRTVPWTYCRSTNTRDLTASEFIRIRFGSRVDMIPQLIQRWRCRLFLSSLPGQLCTFVL